MESDLTYSALHAIVFAVSAALCALLWLMQLRVDRAAKASSGYQLLWLIGFIWAFGNFARYTLQTSGADGEATSIHFAETLAWSCTILGPLAIGRFLHARVGESRRGLRAFRWFTWTVSLLNLSLLVHAARTYSLDVDASGYPTTSLYLGLFVTSIALMLDRLHRSAINATSKEPRPRWFGHGVIVLALVQVLAALLGLRVVSLTGGLHAAASLISEHWVLPWSIFIAVSLAQVHYADVVLKRSLWLLASVTIAAVASAFLMPTWQLSFVVSTLACASLMLISPALIRALNYVIDRMCLNRPDYTEAASQFEESIRGMHDRERLYDAALRSVRSTLRLDAQLVAASEPQSASIRARVPIETASRAPHFLQVSASHDARILMQQELAFLNTISAHVVRRLDALHLEEEQRTQSLREERLKRLLTEAELKALRTQVDPHFLFNTLNTIADLISSHPLQAEAMTERLAECFRYALSRHSRELSTLDDELEFSRHYLEIEQVRFGDRLRIELSRGDARGSEPVPSLLLQPLLENAIKHGLAPIREGGSISVTAKREGEYLRLQVNDSGVGLRQDFGERCGVGLQNVKERLRALYADAATFSIDNRLGERGTSVIIVVPLHGN